MSSFGEAGRHELAEVLQRLRIRAGFTQGEVADQLLWSCSKMSRIESGTRSPILSDLLLLLPLYDVPQAERTAIINLARAARSKPAYIDFHDVLTVSEMAYYEAFTSADVIREYSGPLIPLLLRTTRYCEQIHLTGPRPMARTRWNALMNRYRRALDTTTINCPYCLMDMDLARMNELPPVRDKYAVLGMRP